MQMVQCKCQSCGNELNLDLDNLQAYCPACGSKLLIDMDMLGQIMVERIKTDRIKIESDAKLKKEKEENRFIIIFISCIIGIPTIAAVLVLSILGICGVFG